MEEMYFIFTSVLKDPRHGFSDNLVGFFTDDLIKGELKPIGKTGLIIDNLSASNGGRIYKDGKNFYRPSMNSENFMVTIF